MSSPLFLMPEAGFRRSLVFALCTAGLVALSIALLEVSGVKALPFLRDPMVGRGPLAGLYSNIGVAVMAAAAIVTGWRALTGRGASRWLLGLVCVFAGLFALDDALLLHERLGNSLTPIVMGGYGVLAMLIGFVLHRRHGMRGLWPVLGFVGFFIASAAIDVASDADILSGMRPKLYYVLLVAEDAAKFAGILMFGAFAFGLAQAAGTPGKRG